MGRFDMENAGEGIFEFLAELNQQHLRDGRLDAYANNLCKLQYQIEH